MAGVRALRKGISTTMLCAANSCACCDRSISSDETRNAVCRGYGDLPAALHRARPGDGELLLDLASGAIGCVVALHHRYLRATDQAWYIVWS